MRKWYYDLSDMPIAKPQITMRIHAVNSGPSVFIDTANGNQPFCKTTAKSLIRQCRCLGSGRSCSKHH